MKPPPQKGTAGAALWALPLKLVWAALVITTPLLGVWVASSLAAYRNGPVWATVLAGLGLFPLLPLAWELLGNWRRGRSEEKRKAERAKKGLPFSARPRFLTLFDRLILRTLAVNALFIGGLLASHPQQGFEALSTRGDWMLDGRGDDSANVWRERLFWAAEKLHWLYEWSNENPFREYLDDQPAPDTSQTPQPGPVPTSSGTTTPSPEPPPKPVPGDDGKDEPDEPPPKPDTDRSRSWPLAATLHPAVTSLPADRENSIASVAAYLKEQESDAFFLVKALHDYVADRVAYDAESYVAGRYPPQDAETVFRTQKSVCAGYAQLLTALGRAAGVNIVYVVGDARTEGWDLSGEGHAWNAVEIDGEWYLIDATWNAGSVRGATYTKGYRTAYLFTPPKAFGVNHFPDDPRWQLRASPLTRGEFMRQPVLSPMFYAHGFELLKPDRSQITVSGSVSIDLLNPKGLHVLASYTPVGTRGSGERCDVRGRDELRIDCRFAGEGRYDVRLFANREQYGTFGFIGQLGVNNDL